MIDFGQAPQKSCLERGVYNDTQIVIHRDTNHEGSRNESEDEGERTASTWFIKANGTPDSRYQHYESQHANVLVPPIPLCGHCKLRASGGNLRIWISGVRATRGR